MVCLGSLWVILGPRENVLVGDQRAKPWDFFRYTHTAGIVVWPLTYIIALDANCTADFPT